MFSSRALLALLAVLPAWSSLPASAMQVRVGKAPAIRIHTVRPGITPLSVSVGRTPLSTLPGLGIIPSAVIPKGPAVISALIPNLPAPSFSVPAAITPKESLQGRLGEVLRTGVSLGNVFDGAKTGTSLLTSPGGREVPERGAFELQMDIDRLYGELLAIHQAEKAGVAAEDAKALRERKSALLKDIDGVIVSIPEARKTKHFKTLKTELAAQRQTRDALVKLQRNALAGARYDEIESLSAEAIGLHGKILVSQLQIARAFLRGRSGLKAKTFIRNAALWSLVGAYNSAAILKTEHRYRANLVRASRLFQSGETVIIGRQRWVNAATLLDEAGRDVRNGRAEKAGLTLTTLAALYSSQQDVSAALLRRFALIAGELRRLASRINLLNGPNAPPEGTKDISDAVAALRESIPHPKIRASQDVSFSAVDKAQRAQQHTLSSIHEEYLVILRHQANLELFVDRLASAMAGKGAQKKLSKKDQAAMMADLALLSVWADRGFVQSKQLAGQFLTSALQHLAASDLVNTVRYLDFTAAELKNRLAELERIYAGVSRRAARLKRG